MAILNWGSSQDPEVMHPMCCLAFIQAKFQFYLFSTRGGGTGLAGGESVDTIFMMDIEENGCHTTCININTFMLINE